MTRLELFANIETIGVVVSGVNLPKQAEMQYRRTGDSTWNPAHPLLRIDDGRLIGSLFSLSPSTSYEIKVFDGLTEISGSTTTQPDALQFTPSVILFVNDDAPPGGDGTSSAPFQTIQDGINHATPGTQILVSDGIYHEAILFPTSGTPGNWIQVKAEGNGAILDGSETLSGNVWQPYKSNSHVWFTKITGPIRYLGRNQKNFYTYDDLGGLLKERGHNNITMKEGWYLERSTLKLFVRSHDDPNLHSWQVPHFNDAFSAIGKDWIWIEGFDVRFYGTLYGGCGVCMTNASHIVIRQNRIHNLLLGIFINWTGGENQGNDTRIEYNEIYDPPVNEWPWLAVKGTGMEGTAIIIRGHIGAIVRGNDIHNFFNGIYTGSSGALENSGLAFDADIYNNHIHHIGDDALEPEGACINQRFRNNTVDSAFVGVSLAPITIGPTWIMRSVFSNFTGEGLKWDRNSDGIVLAYHNTFWSNFQNVNGMEMINPVQNAVLRNNIFQVNGSAIYEVRQGSRGHDWNYDNLYTLQNPRIKWENVDYAGLPELCAATGLECNGLDDLPGWTNASVGDFTLLPNSPDIDRGILIPGINDRFTGGAPDIGAFESQFAADLPPRVVSILRADETPSSSPEVKFVVTFSKPVTGMDGLPPFRDFELTTGSEVSGAYIIGVTPVSELTYQVTINTGSGNGTIRLDLIDNNTITDSAGNPLAGIQTDDGSFRTGEAFTIEKSGATVVSILRADRSPTAARFINFTVAFSTSVSGVDPNDFSLTTTGYLNDAYITSVSGTGNTFTVTIDSGGGDGGLRLDLLDNDSIMNAANIPLGGPGAGNGDFTSGESYWVDKTAPLVTGSLRTDPNPTSADSVMYSVVFSEPVSGVDTSDFSISATGTLSGASITSVSGLGYLYIVTVSTGSGDGSLRLDILDDDSIEDDTGQPLAGQGIGNGNFTSGEEYSIDKPNMVTETETIRSNGKNDGWILESREDSNQGGTFKRNTTKIYLGDDKQDRQFRAILDFPTGSLPDNAIITKALLMVKAAGLVGTNPFETHNALLVDIRSGPFGNLGPYAYRGLQAMDFQSPASKDGVGKIINNPYYGWYWAFIDSSAYQYISLTSITQFRLRFELDDNDDRGNDYLSFYSGDYRDITNRPQLVVEYYTSK